MNYLTETALNTETATEIETANLTAIFDQYDAAEQCSTVTTDDAENIYAWPTAA